MRWADSGAADERLEKVMGCGKWRQQALCPIRLAGSISLDCGSMVM
ncbi:MAG: hypothetical protein QF724_02655 [Planctomycetota bacterium]|nr:hypothetical protein [Planctomycetota bacterium]MDP6837811.1 hypothetical protein [Planctomycetota bacterium]MDP6956655.1 hypothetical protein [Planctomycetota bacterium]